MIFTASKSPILIFDIKVNLIKGKIMMVDFAIYLRILFGLTSGSNELYTSLHGTKYGIYGGNAGQPQFLDRCVISTAFYCR